MYQIKSQLLIDHTLRTILENDFETLKIVDLALKLNTQSMSMYL